LKDEISITCEQESNPDIIVLRLEKLGLIGTRGSEMIRSRHSRESQKTVSTEKEVPQRSPMSPVVMIETLIMAWRVNIFVRVIDEPALAKYDIVSHST
jgi:hypothetical protein